MLELIHNNKDHSDVSQLLPWYVNGTLSEDEHRAVEEHVFHCQACQEEIKFLNSAMDTVNKDEALAPDPEQQLGNILNRIDASQPTNQDLPTSGVKSNVIDRKYWFTRPRLALAASFVAAMLLFYWYTPSGTQSTNTFQTLTSSNNDAVKLQITLETEVAAMKLNEFLSQLDGDLAVIDAHPVYTVTIPSNYDVTKLSQLVQTLKSKDYVSDASIMSDKN